MKAHRESDSFKPVILTLETQAEVDCLYAMLNYGPLTDMMEAKFDLTKGAWESLKPFSTDAHGKIFQAISETLRGQ